MQYLGCFLSTTNSINENEDKIIKYFYYRPDMYDDTGAALETILDLRAISGDYACPKIGDRLEENQNYAIESIEISKRLDDTEKNVKKVSYVVACTYDTINHISVRTSGTGDTDKDKDGHIVTNNTPPWKLRNTFTRNTIQVEVPFIKAYNSQNEQIIDVINAAGKRLLASTSKYRFEYTINYKNNNNDTTLEELSGAVINDDEWIPATDGLILFPAKTCLLLPPSFSKRYWTAPNDDVAQDYYEYNIKFIYDPDGWDKKLLNIGTFARFTDETSPAEQIYSYRIKTGSDWGPLQFGNIQQVDDAKNLNAAENVSYEKQTEPLPLTLSGAIDMNAIQNPILHPYETLTFQEFPTYNFDLFTNI